MIKSGKVFQSISKGGWIMIVLASLSIIMISIGYYRENKLKQHHEINKGVITRCYWDKGGKSASYYTMDYLFSLNGKNYYGRATVPCRDISESLLNKTMTGKSLPLIYNPDNPSIHCLLTVKSVYDIYNIPMPDSLRWVDSFLLCK